MIGVFVVELAAYSPACGLLISECFFRLRRCFHFFSSVFLKISNQKLRRITRLMSWSWDSGPRSSRLTGQLKTSESAASC